MYRPRYARRYTRGHGAYKAGRSYVRGSGAYRVAKKSAPRRRRAASRRPRMRGRGKYKASGQSTLGYIGQGVGSFLGASGGASIGSMIAPGIGTAWGGFGGGLGGALLGGKVGDSISRALGWGDYAVAQNSLVYPDRIVPSFGPDTIRVRKREYICDIEASTSFSNNFFAVNPGLSEIFPWLCNLANNYEQYRWNGLIFEYVSQSAVAISATNQLSLGTVCLASDYNAIDPEYINMPQMLSTMFSNSGRPSDNVCHAVECAPTDTANKLYYVRSGQVPSGADIRLYDMLSLQVGVDKLPSGTSGQGIGQLWVSYDITLMKSVSNNQVGFDLNTDMYNMVAPATTAYFGTSRTERPGSNLGMTFGDHGSQGDLSFPPTIMSGWYLIVYQVTGASTAVVAPTVTATNCSIKTAWTNTTATSVSNTGSTFTKFISVYIVEITDRDAYVTYSVGTLPTTPTFGDLVVTQVNGEIYESMS